MPSLHDQRRLKTGAQALSLSHPPASTAAAIWEQIAAVRDGIAALQSLDDLGPVANAQASTDEQELWKRMSTLEARLKSLPATNEEPLEGKAAHRE